MPVRDLIVSRSLSLALSLSLSRVSNVVTGNIPAGLGLTRAMVPYLVSDVMDKDAGSHI